MSQLDLSIEAGVSARHLSFVETGRSRPSPELILRLAEQLDVPLTERNTMLLAGGYAPAYPSHELSDPELAPVRAAVRQILDGHSPYPHCSSTSTGISSKPILPSPCSPPVPSPAS